MKINFRSMANNKTLKGNKVVNYDISQEVKLDIAVEANKYIFPTMTIDEDSNVDSIGYILQNNMLFVQYKCMKRTVEGFELGIRPEPFGYYYHNVDESIYRKLVKAKSKSDFINKYIKKNYIYHREPVGLDLIDLHK